MSSNPAPADLDALGVAYVHLYSGHLLRAALDLGLADTLGDGSATSRELAQATNADPDALRRLLRALVSIGFFRQDEPDRYAHNSLSRLLRSGGVDSANMVGALANANWMWTLWDALTEAVATGRTPIVEKFGKTFYDYLDTDAPETARLFNSAITHGVGSTNRAVAEKLDLSGAHTFVDVGGGQGSMVCEVLDRNEPLRAVLFDIASALENVEARLLDGPAAGRCEIVTGDIRVAAPTGADVYFLRNILHNWDDADCVTILRNCARAGVPGSRVLVVEILVRGDEAPEPLAAIADMQMFLLFGSRERTEPEFARIFRSAGLTYVGATPTASPFHILEARVS